MSVDVNGGHIIRRQFSSREKAMDFYFSQCEAHNVPANVGLVSIESGGVGYPVRINVSEIINGEGEE